MRHLHSWIGASARHWRSSLALAAVLVVIVYGVLFALVGGAVDVPFLYSTNSR